MKRLYTIVFLTSAFCLLTSYLSFSQGTWTQKANFGGIARGFAIGFSSHKFTLSPAQETWKEVNLPLSATAKFY